MVLLVYLGSPQYTDDVERMNLIDDALHRLSDCVVESPIHSVTTGRSSSRELSGTLKVMKRVEQVFQGNITLLHFKSGYLFSDHFVKISCHQSPIESKSSTVSMLLQNWNLLTELLFIVCFCLAGQKIEDKRSKLLMNWWNHETRQLNWKSRTTG